MTATGNDTPVLFTRPDIAYRLGVSPQTIAKWTEEGLPVAVRGKGRRPSKYEESSVRRWVAAHKHDTDSSAHTDSQTPNLTVARARKELAQAVEAEQRVALRAGKLIPIEEVDKLWSHQVAAIRTRLLIWPTALADRIHRVAALEGPAGVERVLLAAAHDALRELAGVAAPKPHKPRPRRKATKRTAAKPRRARS